MNFSVVSVSVSFIYSSVSRLLRTSYSQAFVWHNLTEQLLAIEEKMEVSEKIA